MPRTVFQLVSQQHLVPGLINCYCYSVDSFNQPSSNTFTKCVIAVKHCKLWIMTCMLPWHIKNEYMWWEESVLVLTIMPFKLNHWLFHHLWYISCLQNATSSQFWVEWLSFSLISQHFGVNLPREKIPDQARTGEILRRHICRRFTD